MHIIKELMGDLERDLGKYVGKEKQDKDWQTIFDAVDAMKDMQTICAMDEEYGEGSSYGRRYYPDEMSYRDRGRSYGDRSYRDGGNSYNGDRSYRDGSSYTGSFEDKVRRLMNEAPNDNTRRQLESMMQNMPRY